ncbi:MAG TPA: amidohydrolase family protein [Blastocatellia bacterium]|nr:amidohydrolase family protein [Blastocatellia bacterium]
MRCRAYSAEWILPISSPPIRNGIVLVQGHRILFAGESSGAPPELAESELIEFGTAALLPGFVNSHAHLELTVMRGYLEDLAFRNWINKLTRAKYDLLSPEALNVSAMLGAAEAIRAGITTVADTGDSVSAFDALLASGLRGIAYREVFGPDPMTANLSLADLSAKVVEMRGRATTLVSVGVSPHAPYTVSKELFQLVCEYARRENLDVCIHTAESESEEQLIMNAQGEFADALRSRGIDVRAFGSSTVAYFASIGVLDSSPLLVHCVRADQRDIELMARSKSRVAHCPKSNAKLGHGIAPLAGLLKAGVRVGIGTDSVASNNRCDIIDEGRFCCLVHRADSRTFTDPAPRDVLKLMTQGGAEALGLGEVIGTLEPGKYADLIAVDLSRAHNTPVNDPEAAILFSCEASDVVMTMVAGRMLFEGGQVNTLDEARLRIQVDGMRRLLVGSAEC